MLSILDYKELLDNGKILLVLSDCLLTYLSNLFRFFRELVSVRKVFHSIKYISYLSMFCSAGLLSASEISMKSEHLEGSPYITDAMIMGWII